MHQFVVHASFPSGKLLTRTVWAVSRENAMAIATNYWGIEYNPSVKVSARRAD